MSFFKKFDEQLGIISPASSQLMLWPNLKIENLPLQLTLLYTPSVLFPATRKKEQS
jgi:hypothetical protein